MTLFPPKMRWREKERKKEKERYTVDSSFHKTKKPSKTAG
tara:strand:- start:1487 stop:1606 length:120 start_codon:yes stop_codon:yes gene_type:complete